MRSVVVSGSTLPSVNVPWLRCDRNNRWHRLTNGVLPGLAVSYIILEASLKAHERKRRHRSSPFTRKETLDLYRRLMVRCTFCSRNRELVGSKERKKPRRRLVEMIGFDCDRSMRCASDKRFSMFRLTATNARNLSMRNGYALANNLICVHSYSQPGCGCLCIQLHKLGLIK